MKEAKICKVCSEEYSGKGKYFCSRACSSIGTERQKPTKRVDCLTCGQQCGRADTKYCCNSCYTQSRKGKPSKNSGKKQSAETIAKRIANTAQSKKEQKHKETMLEKYGVEYASQLDEVKAKLSELQKGSTRPRTEEHQNKIIQAKIENGTTKHTEEARSNISKGLKEYYSNPEVDRSVYISEGSNGRNSKTGRYNGIYFRSSYEEAFLKFCERYGIEVISAGNKDFCVKYLASDNEVRSYYPDFYLPSCDTVVEIKPINMFDFGENYAKFDAAMKHIQNYRIVTELDGILDESNWEEFYENDVKYWLTP